MKWRMFLCHSMHVNNFKYILCNLHLKKKNMNDTRFRIDYITAFHACWLQYHTRLWDISAIWLFVDWLTFLLFFSDRGESKQESIRGTLHYLFEGVMPFLQVNIHWDPASFCKKTNTHIPKAVNFIYRLRLSILLRVFRIMVKELQN